jgi:bacterioferritin-associated ferredoxin
MYICMCNAITDRQIVQAAREGARSPEDLASGLGVGLSCGRCAECAHAILCETVARLSGPVAEGAVRAPALAAAAQGR